MRAMKDSGIEWIGQIPQEWQIAKVKHVYSFQTGWTPSTSNAAYFDGDLPWANISDIGKTKTIYDTAKHITEEAVANSSMGISPKGSLMYSFKLSVGDVSFCGTDMYTNEAIATFLPSDKYDLRYLYYAAPLFIIKNANENIYGAKLLNQELIRNALILNPPYNEQVSVADYLDAKCAEIDALISAKEKTNALLKERRQSIIYEAVTKGLNPNAPMKDSGVEWIGEIPEHWTKWRMKHLASEPLQYGANATGVEFREDIPRYVRITDITADRKLSDEGKQSLEMDIAQDYMLEDGDILFARSGATSGKSFYYESQYGSCCFAGYLIRLRTDSRKALSKLLYYYTLTQAYESWTQQIFIQATIQNISADKYNNLWFAIPESMEEQKEIVVYLDQRCSEMDELISANEATIKKLKEYRQSIIYEAVTGKIEI